MSNLGNFNANEHENKSQFDPIPAGEYAMIATKSELKPNSKGTGKNLHFTFQIVSGPFQNRLVFQTFTWENPTVKAVQIGKGQFSELARAVGVLTPSDSSQLHNIPFVGKVFIEKGTGGFDDKNKVAEFKTAAGQSVRKKGQPAAQPAAPGAQPAAVGTGAAPGRPW